MLHHSFFTCNSITHFNDVPARHVSLAFVLASANGVGSAFPIVRTSHILMTPSDEAEAIRLESSDPSFRLSKTATPFTRVA
uniref:Uncharacterized protein n=1 Tax=Arundo donax TaxID=35708 RepID=A0A0A9E589_ARUDO